MNVKLWGGVLAVAVTLLALWQVNDPPATLIQGTVESVPASDGSVQASPARVVLANAEGVRGSMTDPLDEKPILLVAAGSSMPASPTAGVEGGDQSSIAPDSLSLNDVAFLDSDQEFTKVADVLRLSTSLELTRKQRSYEAFFAKLPAVGTAGVQVQDLLCGQKLCIATVVANQPQDMDAFFGSLSRTSSANAPIYASVAVESEVNGATVRRFAFSTDPNIREVPLKIGDSPQ